MFNKLITSKKFLIGLGIVATIVLIINYFISNQSKPVLLAYNPSNNSKNINVLDPVELQFQELVSSTDFTAISTPSNNWSITNKDDKNLVVKHIRPLTQNTKYLVQILWKNKDIVSLTFTTQDTQTDYELLDKLKTELERDYPLANNTPYNSSLYYAVYSAPMTFEITIKNPNITSAQAISEIKSWVTSVGGNADAHKYVISNKPFPSVAPLNSSVSPQNSSSPSPTPFNWDTLQDDGT